MGIFHCWIELKRINRSNKLLKMKLLTNYLQLILLPVVIKNIFYIRYLTWLTQSCKPSVKQNCVFVSYERICTKTKFRYTSYKHDQLSNESTVYIQFNSNALFFSFRDIVLACWCCINKSKYIWSENTKNKQRLR